MSTWQKEQCLKLYHSKSIAFSYNIQDELMNWINHYLDKSIIKYYKLYNMKPGLSMRTASS